MSTFDTDHDVLEPRDVLLGRTTHVRRLLPHKVRRTVGAWCFLDHYGPDDIKEVGGMWVPPHPHTGLQTVTWLFEGLGRHTDSLGSDQLIRPGQLNVMTAGHGICHAEVSPEDAPRLLHGVQLWVALPDEHRDSAPADFTHLAELPSFAEDGVRVTVMVGSLAGHASPAPAYSPLVGAELRMEPGASVTLPVEAGFEHAVLAVDHPLEVAGAPLERHRLVHLPERSATLTVGAPEGGIALLLGGEPFQEQLVMWWNFIGRSHEEVVEMREAWNGSGVDDVPERFGQVAGFDGPRLLAPPLPNTRLKAR
ncbi:pirin family protein [Nocardioides caldifontis]|uniref:pirin family protein n=1 Tax=Nocardioides caldifontis TaxID=2588938 RepID=UPI00193AD648|nr:pirin family protein [Nocardioides caldifontis]